MSVGNHVQKISILGCGWLGKPLGASLIEDGYEVAGSVTRKENLDQVNELGIKACVINFNPEFSHSDADLFFETGVLIISIPPRRKTGSEDFYFAQLHEIRRKVTEYSVPKVIFISSTSALVNNGNVVQESDVDSMTMLARGEDLFKENENFKCTIVRFAGLVGPGRHPGRFLSGKEVPGGSHPVNIIHQADCIGIIKQVVRRGAWGEVFNACASEHPAKAAFYNQSCLQLGLPLPTFVEGKSDFKMVSNQKVLRDLEYDFKYPDPMRMEYE